ncbi:MAG: O-antigen ligase family protein [Gammaproteobacteria bacterium]|nr:MAG: O-antigen ligase family protein [Gammaproteobacteria bacterium]
MSILKSTKLSSFFIWYSSIAILIFSALSLIMPNGYSYGPILLFIGSLSILVVRPSFHLIKEDIYIIGALSLYFIVNIFLNYLHHLPLSSYDKPLRYLLGIPVYFFLIAYPPKQIFFWSGLVVGAIGACLLAMHQRFFEGGNWWRPGGFINPIQFGDIALLLGILLLSGIQYLPIRTKHNCLMTIYLFAAAMGITASFLSWSRGGWLAIPIVGLVFLKRCNFSLNKKSLFYLIIILIFSIILIHFLPDDNFLKARFVQTESEITDFYRGKTDVNSVSTRFKMWHVGISAFKDAPFVGWGDLASIKENYSAYWKDLNELNNYNHLHNEYIDELAKRGLIGFFSLMVLYFIPLMFFLRMSKYSVHNMALFSTAGIVLILSCMMFGLTQVFMIHNSGATIFVFYLVIVASYCRNIYYVGLKRISNSM